MKNQVTKRLKKVLAAVLATSMLLGMGMISNARTESENEGAAGVVFRKASDYYTNYETLMSQKEAPEYETNDVGYVFGGWFVKNGNVYDPIIEGEDYTGEVYAKFVSAQTLSVKCQNQAELENPETATKTAMKLVTGVDSVNYREVGFEVRRFEVSSDGKSFVRESGSVTVKSSTVYHSLKINGKEYEPEAVFKGSATDYFATAWITEVEQAFFDGIVCIEPYWVTLDGTTVRGLTKYAHVMDAFPTDANGNYAANGEYRWVNIPINVRCFKEVAAGVLTMKSPEEFTGIKIECGRLFKEMDFALKAGNKTAKFVGNLSEMTANATEDAIYANVRFIIKGTATDIITGYTFEVTDEDFADIAENQYTSETGMPVWNVAY